MGIIKQVLAAIPAWAYALGIMALALLWTAHSRAGWIARDNVAETSLASVKAAQVAVNKAVVATKARVETDQSTVTKGTDDATVAALAGVRADYAAYRLRHPAAARAPGASNLPGVPESAAGSDCAAGADAAIPSAQLIDFAEQGDVWRQRLADVQDWYAKQAAVDRTPAP